MRNPLQALFEQRVRGSLNEFVEYLSAGLKSSAGVDVSESTAMRVAAVTTCLSLVSRTFASLPLDVFQRESASIKRPAENHWLDRVLSQPNPWQHRFNFLQTMEVYLLLYRNAFAWINWVETSRERRAVELIPLHPRSIEIDQVHEFAPPTYVFTTRDGRRLPMPASEVFHLRGLSTDGVIGRSSLVDGRDMVGRAQVQDEHAASFWRGGGMPNTVLKHPKTLSDKAKLGLEKSWQASYGSGPEQRRVAVIEEGMDVSFPSLTNEASQFLETRTMSRSEIAGWFHVPPFMIGDTEKQTSWGDGVEQNKIAFLQFTLRPDLELWKQTIAQRLLPAERGIFAEFNVNGLLQGDAKTQAEYLRAMREIGLMTTNEGRALMNWNPVSEEDGGDRLFRPTTWIGLNEATPQPVPGATK